jgi:hypothetical protein
MSDVDGDVGVHFRNHVATYRVYHLDRAGHVTRPAWVIEAPDDITAIARARTLMDDGDQLEIWEGSRQVSPPLAPDTNERR